MEMFSAAYGKYLRKLTKASSFGAAFLAVTACSHSAQIAEHAGHYNDTLAIVEDEMMLKNILRAAKRRKMHFTRLQSFTGSLSSSASLTSKLRAGADGATEAFFDPLALSTKSSPGYSMTAMNSKEFFNGILTPISPTTIKLFLDQGWAFPLLLSIFVESVTVKSTNANAKNFECTIDNDPFKDMPRFAEFVKIASNLLEDEFKTDEASNPFGPAIPAIRLQDGLQLEAIRNTELKLKDMSDGTFQLQSPSSVKAFKIKTVQYPVDWLIAQQSKLEDACTQKNIAALNPSDFKTDASAIEAKRKTIELRADAKLRSAQGMIYFLGELSRFDMMHPALPEEKGHNVGANKYWNVVEGETPNAVISASVRGVGSIAIPEGHTRTDNTLNMLTLVQQVFDLNTASDKTPSVTPFVRLVN